MTEPGLVVRAEDQPSWAEIVYRAERGESVSVIAHGGHVRRTGRRWPGRAPCHWRMTRAAPYAITVIPAARRRLRKLPLSAAAALHEHLTGPVAGNPHRLGKPSEAPFADVLSTRRGDYRALYTVDDQARVVTVLAVAHRRDAHRSR